MPSILKSFKKREVKSPATTFLKLISKLLVLFPSTGEVSIEISWKPCKKRTFLASVKFLVKLISPSLSKFHFLSFNTNDDALNFILTPWVEVSTSALRSASLRVLLALVFKETLEKSLWDAIKILVLGKSKLSLTLKLFMIPVKVKVSIFPIPFIETPVASKFLYLAYGINKSILNLFSFVSMIPVKWVSLNPLIFLSNNCK